jgi:hypothetical protein
MKKTDDEFENYTKNGDLAFLLEYMGEQTCFQNLLQSSVYSYSYNLRITFFELLKSLLLMFDHNITLSLHNIL